MRSGILLLALVVSLRPAFDAMRVVNVLDAVASSGGLVGKPQVLTA